MQIDINDTDLTFGHALEALKAGRAVARKGWNGKGMFIYLIKGRSIPAEKFHAHKNEANKFYATEGDVVLTDHIDMKAADGTYVTGWLASQTDMLAEDWEIIKTEKND